MDIWTAFDQMTDFLQIFTPNIFDILENFFSFETDGILSYWPFFLSVALFIFFCIVKGIINLLNDL